MMGLVDTISKEFTHDPSTCLYFSLVTWTTLGYGDFRPVPNGRLVAASEAVIGYVMMIILIGFFSRVARNIMSSPDEGT
jgi:Ion channel